MPSLRVRGALGRVFQERGVPKFMRSDNGSEFIATDLKFWLEDLGIDTHRTFGAIQISKFAE